MKRNSFEQKLEKTREILNQLMNPEITLEEGLKLYQEGISELKSAQEMIEEAKVKIDEVYRKDS